MNGQLGTVFSTRGLSRQVLREHLPLGFVKTKADFVEEVTKGAGAMSCMMEEGEPMCTLDVPGPNPKVHIRKYNLAKASKAVQVRVPQMIGEPCMGGCIHTFGVGSLESRNATSAGLHTWAR